MKKLMIVAAVVCAAAMSHAAAANWQATAYEIHDGTGVEESYYSGSALIFDASVISQSALYDIFAAGTAIGSTTAGYVGAGTVDAGTLSGAKWEYGEQGDGKTYNYFFALVDTDKIYLSETAGNTPNSSATAKSIGFGDQYDWEGGVSLPNSYATATDGYVEAGRWAAVSSGSIPEPTSGLLVLLGIAGLALRRRRA